MKKIFLAIILTFVVSFNNLISDSYNAEIRLNNKVAPIKIENHKLFFGCFFEFLNDFMNGTNGLWAQEIYDRGFDAPLGNFLRIWKKSSHPENIRLIKGGYNENGVYAIGLTGKSDGDFTSVSQETYFDMDKGNIFYIYIKNKLNEPAKLNILLKSTKSDIQYYKGEIIAQPGDWKKYTLEIPKLNYSHSDLIEIGLDGKGDIEIDECSLMRADNVNGIRKEFYDLFKIWKPGVIRYPGGCFADAEFYKLEISIGDIDKRKSPIYLGNDYYQRMDFGLDEYCKFCEDMNAEKHIVLNLQNGNEIEARNYIEYCNSGTNTKFGALRAKNGRTEPYKIKYCEIGNEQWFDTTWMVNKYLKYYDEIIKVDNSLRFFIDGNIWDEKSFFDACMQNTRGKCHNFSYHFCNIAIPKDPTVKYDENDRFEVVMSMPESHNNQLIQIEDWLRKDNYFPFAKQSITEHNLVYRIPVPQWIDTNYMNAALEGGLYQANFLLNNLKNGNTFELYEKTFGLNHIRIGRDKNGKRTIYPTVLHNSISFLKNNTGDNIYDLEVTSPKYNNKHIEGLIYMYDIKYIFANYSKDSLNSYLYIINRSADKDANVTIDNAILNTFKDYNIYELNSDSYLDYNSPNEPNKIDYRLTNEKINGNVLTVKPHSLKVLISKNHNSVKPHFDLKFYINRPDIKFLNLNEQRYECSIYNILGEKVFETDTDKAILSLPDIPTGIYIMLFKINNQEYRYKFYW